MNRKELYAKVKELNLQEEVKKEFGKNFTQVSSEDLEQIIWNYDATHASKAPKTKKCKECTKAATEITDAYEAACIAFVGILKDSGKLDEILKNLK